MKIDLWHRDEEPAFVDCTFYPGDMEYRGNIYNRDGRPIGDYVSKNSVEIERRFPGIFSE